ncbi:MAG TPA: acyl-CoA dehydrogenase family protein [Sphingomonas sp.]|nr:acyl-CoA dehydrogenase family protein [Sphingomonas sp.]
MAVLNDEQAMLRDMARGWADNEAPVSAFRRLRDAGASEGYDAAAWAEIAGMGWAGIVIPEAFGGSAFGYLSLGLVLEQLGRNLAASPLASTAVAATAIAEGESDAARTWLPKIASGELVATLAIDERPTHDRVFAASVSDGRLTGTKAFVAEGDAAGLFVVAAGDGLYLVEGDAEGVARSSRRMVDSRSHAEVRFDRAPAERLGDTSLVDRVCDLAAAATTAEMLGLAGQAFETTNAYLKQRVQFGHPLATFQALQHRMAKMFTELELMRSAVEGALEAIDAGHSDVAEVASLAKAIAGDTLHLVSREMIQLHGGIGMTDEHDAGFYLKRAQVLETMWGSAAWHRERFARLNGY